MNIYVFMYVFIKTQIKPSVQGNLEDFSYDHVVL